MNNKPEMYLRLILILCIIIFGGLSPAYAATLKFAQVSDIHLSLVKPDNHYKLLSQTQPLLKDAINQINSEKHLDFTIVTGDGVDRPQKDSICTLINELNSLKEPWYFAVGNHDTNPFGEMTKDNLFNLIVDNNKNFNFPSSYYSFKPKRGFRVIVMDGAHNDKISSSGIISQEQLCWLDEILKKSKRDTVLIFIHFPLITPYDIKKHEISNAEEFKKVLSKYDMPIAIFSGHYHMTKITKRDNELHVSTPSLANYPNAFRIVEVKNTHKNVTFNIRLKETQLKDIQKKAKITFLGGSVYYGKERDRNNCITVRKK